MKKEIFLEVDELLRAGKRMVLAMIIASARAVEASYIEAFAASIAVRRAIIVWYSYIA